MSLRVLLLGALAGALVAAPAASAAVPTGLRAGAASADITPPIGTPMFAYTARSAIAGGHVDRPMQIVADPDPHLYAKTFVPSQGIHTRVQARAIVLEQKGLKYALVQADLGGVPYALTNEVAKRVATSGIPEERILLAATHTHASTGPIWPADSSGYAALGGDLFDPRLFEMTAQGIAQAILDADARLQPAKAGIGTAQVTDASNNRSYEPYTLNAEVAKNADGSVKDPAAAKAASIDSGLTVVRVDDRKGRPLAVWSNFSVHPTSFGDGNLLFSGDNAGVTEEIVSRTLGERAGGREVVDVWTNGNEGDLSPNGGPDTVAGQQADYVTSDFASAHRTGVKVARGVLSAWSDAGRRMRADLPIATRRSFMAFDGTPADGEPVGPQAVLGAGVVQEGMCAPVDGMAGPGQGKKFPGLAGAGLVPNVIPVAMWRIGGLGVAALPLEITKTMGARIRAGLLQQAAGAFDRVTIAGLSNAYVSYASTPEEYDACQYEGSFTLFGRRQGARVLDMTKLVSAALLGGSPAPAGITPPALGAGTTSDVPARQTPSAGTAATQPAASVTRYGRASFSWNGGDPAVDAPRGQTFVKVQRRVGKAWETEVTDASFRDITARAPGDVYTETVQFGECDPTGTYRIAVMGRADKGSGVAPYEVTSSTFTLAPLTLSATPVQISGRFASVQALYPNPGPEALLSLPRLVRSGIAIFRVNGKQRAVAADPDTASFRLAVPDRATVELVRVTDRCGNTTA